MAEVVKADLGEPSSLEERGERALAQVSGFDERTALGGKDKTLILPKSGPLQAPLQLPPAMDS